MKSHRNRKTKTSQQAWRWEHSGDFLDAAARSSTENSKETSQNSKTRRHQLRYPQPPLFSIDSEKVENISNSGGSHGLLGMRNSGHGQKDRPVSSAFFTLSLFHVFRSFPSQSPESDDDLPFCFSSIFRILIVKPARF